jgi:hypothetical protein
MIFLLPTNERCPHWSHVNGHVTHFGPFSDLHLFAWAPFFAEVEDFYVAGYQTGSGLRVLV